MVLELIQIEDKLDHIAHYHKLDEAPERTDQELLPHTESAHLDYDYGDGNKHG